MTGAETELAHLFWRLQDCRTQDECRDWIDLAESATQHPLCCSNLGDWEPNAPECGGVSSS